MKRYFKYVAGAMVMAGIVAMMACTGDEPTAPVTEPTAPAAATAMPAEPTPTEAMAAPTDAIAMQAGDRLAQVRSRGHVVCANNTQLAGFGYIDADGNTKGFDVDLCRAVAAAVLGDADAVEYQPTTAAERGPTMQSGQVDMMSRNTTWTSSRDATWGNFAQTMFYDGQGFMVPASLGVSGALELQDAKVCVQQGTPPS